MNYSGIIYNDIANGIGVRTSLFVSGCRNNCPGCFNKEQQNFAYGDLFTEEVQEEIIKSIKDKPYIKGLSILGGEPMEPENARELFFFVQRFHVECPDKTIWLYTGYTYEHITELSPSEYRERLLKFVDVLVDGPFVESKKDITLKFRGSSNQRIIDVKASLSSGKVVELKL